MKIETETLADLEKELLEISNYSYDKVINEIKKLEKIRREGYIPKDQLHDSARTIVTNFDVCEKIKVTLEKLTWRRDSDERWEEAKKRWEEKLK